MGSPQDSSIIELLAFPQNVLLTTKTDEKCIFSKKSLQSHGKNILVQLNIDKKVNNFKVDPPKVHAKLIEQLRKVVQTSTIKLKLQRLQLPPM